MRVEVVVNLFGFVEVLGTFLVVSVVVVEYAQVKVIEELGLFAVEVFLLFLDFVDGGFEAVMLKYGGESLVTSHGLVCASHKKQSRSKE